MAWSFGRLPLFAHERCTQCHFKALPWEAPSSGSLRNEINHVCNHTEEAVTLLLGGKMSKLHDALYLPQIWQYTILLVRIFLLSSTRPSLWVIISRLTSWSYFVMPQTTMSSCMLIIHVHWATQTIIGRHPGSFWYQRTSVSHVAGMSVQCDSVCNLGVTGRIPLMASG